MYFVQNGFLFFTVYTYIPAKDSYSSFNNVEILYLLLRRAPVLLHLAVQYTEYSILSIWRVYILDDLMFQQAKAVHCTVQYSEKYLWPALHIL